MARHGADRAVFIARDQHRIGARRHGPFDEAMRGHPDVDLPHVGRLRLRVRSLALHVPGDLVEDVVLLPLFALERDAAAADARVIALLDGAVLV